MVEESDVWAALGISMEEFCKGMGDLSKAFLEVSWVLGPVIDEGKPRNGPRTLPSGIDGHEYHRRQMNRKKRR